MNDKQSKSLLDWFRNLRIGNLLNVNIGGTTGSGLATEVTLADIKTSVQTLDNAISGNEMQVDIVAAIPAGTNLIGEVATYEKPDATSTYTPNSDLSAAYEASSVSKASAGTFYGLSGYNSAVTGQFICVGDESSVPANGAVVPIARVFAAPMSNFAIDTGKFGMFCSTGIVWWNSTASTPFTKTLGAADCAVTLLYK